MLAVSLPLAYDEFLATMYAMLFQQRDNIETDISENSMIQLPTQCWYNIGPPLAKW